MLKEKNDFQVLWIFLFLLVLICSLLFLLVKWEDRLNQKKLMEAPFSQVTNRQFSLFLWQNPEFMRANRRSKLGYLPEFSEGNDTRVIPTLADDYVIAPPLVIFRYHVWERLIGRSLASRPIRADEFLTFLEKNPEWMPAFWKIAPPEYQSFVEGLLTPETEDIQGYSLLAFPYEARLAFQGWKNYIYEWSEIENLSVEGKELALFLETNPSYNRSFWRNILIETLPNYLDSFLFGARLENGNPDELISEKELSNFLKAALYNNRKALEKGIENAIVD